MNIEKMDIECLRVLFIDDEVNLLMGLARNIPKIKPKWKPYFSTSPEDAISVIHGYAGRLDVVVSDIDMPEMDGLSVLTVLRDYYPNITRISFSGRLDPYSIIGSKRLSHKHICKPIDVDLLCAHIQQAYSEVLSRKDKKID